MGTIETIKRMQQEGRTDQEIIFSLQTQGTPVGEIRDALAQAKIKQAVNSPQQDPSDVQATPATESMQPSMLDVPNRNPATQAPPAPQTPLQAPIPSPEENYQQPPQQPYPALDQQAYPPQPDYLANAGYNQMQGEYAPPQPSTYPEQSYQAESSGGYNSGSYGAGGVSTDTLNEISDQIMAEKLGPLQKKIEEALSFKNMMESRVDFMDERIKRIEKTIDRLQLSVLQKVGDYITNIEDIKHELAETQQTFKAMAVKAGVFNQQPMPHPQSPPQTINTNRLPPVAQKK